MNLSGLRYILHVAAYFCLVSLLDFQEQEEQQDSKRVHDDHGFTFYLLTNPFVGQPAATTGPVPTI